MRCFRTIIILLFAVSLAARADGAGTAMVNVTATIISKNICSFRTANINLGFGNLNPFSPVNVTAATTATFRCMGSGPTVVYFVSEDYGLNETGPGGNRMQHATTPTAFLPYSLTITPQTGTFPREVAPVDHFLTITGLVKGVDYQTALLGSYSDTVVLTIVP